MNISNINKLQYHYFYKITNLINNHFYYGVHNTNNLNDGYMGSGKRLNYAFKKYGKENFKKEILKFFKTSKEAFEYEEYIVNENLINNDKCYNLCNGGINPKLLSDDVINNKLKKYQLIKHQQGERNSQYNTCWINNTIKNKKIKKDELESYINLGWVKGKILKNSNRKLAQIKFVQNIYTNEIKPLLINEIFDNNWKLIKLHDAKLRTKLCRKYLNITGIGETNSQYNTCWINNTIENKKIKKDELESYINLGWVKGQLKFIWIHNSIKNTRVLESKLNQYLNNGWILGKLKK